MATAAAPVTRQEAAAELLRRRRARSDLLAFAEYTHHNFQPGSHHRVLCDALMLVEAGKIDRLIIEAPPRHTKSEIASRRFPAWYLGRNPGRQIITSTYAADFAADFGRDVRGIVREPAYGRIFGTQLRQDSQAADRWHTQDGGIYVAVGIGGPITGRGAHLAIIDDPIKNREEAESEVIRNKIWNWYTSTLYTRLMPGGAVIVIMTRWHEDDLVGRLLTEQERGGDKWHRITLRAIDGEGTDHEKALWPEWYPLDALKRIKAAIGPRDWSALYQQSPQPAEGTFFQRAWFRRYAPQELPASLNRYGTSDYAVTDGAGDFTEHAVWGVDSEDNLWAVDWWSGQTTSDVWIERQIDMMARHKPYAWFGESGVIRRSIEGFLTKRMRERKTFGRVEWVTSASDKPSRARGFQARAAMGKVHIPLTEWGDRLIDQLIRFPAGKHDDAVDACSMIATVIDQTHPAIVRSDSPKKKPDRWDGVFRKLDQAAEKGDWRTA